MNRLLPPPLQFIANRMRRSAAENTAQTDAAIAALQDVQDPAEKAQLLAQVEGEKTKRTIIRSVALLAIAATAAAGGWYVSRNIGKTAPHAQVITQEQVDTALGKVVLRDDTIILTGQGTSSAQLSSTSEVCEFGTCAPLPGGGSQADANVSANIDIISKDGAVVLHGVSDGPGTNTWHVEADVNGSLINPQLSNEHAQLSGQDDAPIQIINAFGLDTGANGRRGYVVAVAEKALLATCAQPLTSADVLAAAEANAIHDAITQEEGLLKDSDPTGYQLLEQMASKPIQVSFTGPGVQVKDGSTVVVPYAKQPASQTARATTNEVQTNFTLTTSGDNCMLTSTAAQQLDQLRHSSGYQLNLSGS